MLRFAPSPTGDMDIGNLRVAIYNYIIANKQDKPFLVRIADTDKARNIEGKDTEIMQILEKFAIKHDTVYHQSEHLNIHQTLAIKLLQEGKAFICKCTPEELGTSHQYNGKCEMLTPEEYQTLKDKDEPFVIRLKKPTSDIIHNDLIKGSITTSPDDIGSFIIMQADNTPTANFASACDDMLSNIDVILQEEDQLENTLKQIHIKTMLGYEEITEYAHLPRINNARPIKSLFEEGFIPDAIINYLILLGNNQAHKEIFTLPEAIEWFTLDSISKNAAAFDIKKLRVINRGHLKMMDDKELSKLFGFADSDIGKLAKVYLEEVSTVKELEAKIRPIFTPKNFECEWGESMRVIKELIFNAPVFVTFNEFENHISQESGLQGEKLLNPLRMLLTGADNGPELSQIYPYIKSYLLEVAS